MIYAITMKSTISFNNITKPLLDQTMDTDLKKYVDGILICAKYMDGKNGNTCLAKRWSKMESSISKLHKNISNHYVTDRDG